MSEKKELNEEELTKATGGRLCYFCNKDRSEYSAYNNVIDGNDCQLNEKYLFVYRYNSTRWLFASIYNSYTHWKVFFSERVRVLDVIVIDGNEIEVINDGGTLEIRGEDYYIYKI